MSFFGFWHEKTRGTMFASALGAVVIAGSVAVPQMSTQTAATVAPREVALAPQVSPDLREAVTKAVNTFVDGMAQHKEEVVWMFASEEDQAAFGTEAAVYQAFAEAFPQLTSVSEIRFGPVREEGETPFVPAVVRGEDGAAWVADFGLWKNDAGDWTLISLDIKPASDNAV